jgi:hypothetical protein
MTFYRQARVSVLATAETQEGQLRVASKQTKSASHFLTDGARVIDVQAILSKVAETYAISAEPSDYFFEAIRANTTNAPNDNNDAFHVDELLKFSTLIGKPVYRTYEEKPHHIQHRASNPRAARGVILAVHYNAETPAMAECPTCQSPTGDRADRDRTGLHCKKCGTLVKDEFVEALVGIDKKKDKRFAEAVEQGILVTASMGCNCESTTCNVCDHVAYTRAEFCPHIRSAKGSYWTSKNGQWARINEAAVQHELESRGLKYVAQDFMRVRAEDGFEVRKAFESCNNVTFEELSRVDVPADPKARSIEVIASHTPTAAELAAETEALLNSVKSRTAAPKAKEAVDLQVSPGDPPITIVPSPNETPSAPTSQVPEAPAGAPPAPGEPPAPAPTPAPGVPPEQMQLDNMGLMPSPPGASKQAAWKETYKGFAVQGSTHGNLRVLDRNSTPILLIKAHATKQPREYAREVLASVFADGLVATAAKFKGLWSPRLAQVSSGGLNDMVGHDDHERVNSVLDDVQTDGPARKPEKAKSVADGGETDGPMRDKPTKDVADGGAHDFAERQPPPKSVLDGGDMAQTERPEKRTVKDRVNDGGVTDRAAARIEKLAEAKIAAAEERARKAEVELQRAKVAAEKDALASCFRLLRIAAKRVSNETLQSAVMASLIEARVLNDDPITAEPVSYRGMNEQLAARLAHEAVDVGLTDFVAQLETETRHLASRSAEYINDLEKDMGRRAERVAAPIVMAASLGEFSTPANLALRQAAVEGNLMFAPTPASTFDRGGSLRAAVTNTRTAKLRDQLVR